MCCRNFNTTVKIMLSLRALAACSSNKLLAGTELSIVKA